MLMMGTAEKLMVTVTRLLLGTAEDVMGTVEMLLIVVIRKLRVTAVSCSKREWCDWC